MSISKIRLFISGSARTAEGFVICPRLRQVWLAERRLLRVLLSVIFTVFAVICR